MVSIKSKLNILDIMIGMGYSQLRFPTLLVWLGIIGMNFYHQVLPLLISGSVLFGLVLLMIYILRLTLIMLGVVLFFSIVGKFTGSLKNHFLLLEYTFDGATMICKGGEQEAKTTLDSIQTVYEDKKRFFLFKTGFKFEVISKRLMTSTEIQQVREFFKPKINRFVHYAFRAFPYFILIIAGFTLWGVFKPSYYMDTSTGRMEAFYQDDELVFAITSNSMGHSETLYDGIFPPKKPKFVERKPYIETRFYDIKKGKLTQQILTGHEYMALHPYGQDIYCVSQSLKESKFLKFDGKQFVPITPQERDALKGHEENPIAAGWKFFELWDENDQETADNDPLKGEDDWATFPLKTSTVKIHYMTSVADPKTYSTQQTYTLKGLTPNGEDQELFTVKDGTKKIDRNVFESDFPQKASAGEGAKP